MNKNYTQLKYLESTGNIKVSVQKLTGRELNTTTAKAICTYIQQGRMFLDNAESAPNEIKPLILHYAVASFAKAIVCVRTLRSSIPSSHGLSDVSNITAKLESIAARIEGNGLFQAFNDAIRETEGVYYYHNAKLCKHNTPTASSTEIANQTITLKEVLSRIGRISEMYEQTFSHKSNSQNFELTNYERDIFTLIIGIREPYTDRQSVLRIIAEMRQRFPALSNWHIDSVSHSYEYTGINFNNLAYDLSLELSEAVFVNNPENNSYRVNYAASRRLSENDNTLTDILGTVGGGQNNGMSYFVTPYNESYFSELSLRLIGMFLLSSLVRYRPQIWIHSLSHAATTERPLDDQMLALIEQFIDSTVQMFVDVTVVACGLRAD
jgi:hypothetical protein